MHTIVTTSEPHDLLALVPQLIGFRPRDSLVLVAFGGSRTCGAYRVDLPRPAGDVVNKRLATTLVGMLCRVRGADGVIPIVYTDDRFLQCGGIPREAFTATLIDRAHTAGFSVKDALCVAADGWGSYLAAPGVRATPLPLARIEGSRAPAGIPRADEVELCSPQQRATLPRIDRGRRDRIQRACARLRAAPPDGQGAGLVELAETVLRNDGDQLPAELAALLLWAIQRPALRDVLLFSWAWGRAAGSQAAELNRRHTNGEAISPDDPAALGLAGIGMPRPDVRRMRSAIDLVLQLAAAERRTARAPALTMLAWLHWALGSGTIAGEFIRRARAGDPDYSLAELLDAMLHSGMLPDWVFG